MSLIPTVTLRHLPPSEPLRAYVMKRADKLETFAARIRACSVTVEAPHHHNRHGDVFRVRVEIALPGDDVVVEHRAEDAYAAIDGAFDVASRALVEHARRARDVGAHARTASQRV
jgi:ribosomal subunit interface protein